LWPCSRNFVDEQVEEKIAATREKVAAIWGRGTTVAQTEEVRAFYGEVRSILKGALKEHALRRFNDFAQHLTAHANAIPDRALSEVGAQIERTAINIRAAAEAAVTDQKEAFERIATELVSAISAAHREILTVLAEDDSEPVEERKLEKTVRTPSIVDSATDSPPVNIQARATQCVERYILRNGAKKWPFTRIFAPQYLRGASEGWLIDPYLALRHQRRNLGEFVMAVLEAAKLKTLHIITREVSDVGPNADKPFFDALDRDAFEKAGMRIEHTIDKEIHDRSFVLDNGFVFKLGRGLDIFKPVAGLASRDPSLRQVRSCEIDVFGPKAV
jgi:Phospholipase D-like domain at C-terminus of MIT